MAIAGKVQTVASWLWLLKGDAGKEAWFGELHPKADVSGPELL